MTALFGASIVGIACSEDDASNVPSEEERQNFIDDIEGELQGLRDEIAQLQDNVSGSDAAGEVENQADALGDRINEAEGELDSLRNAGDGEWQSVRDELQRTLDSAGSLANDIGREFGIE